MLIANSSLHSSVYTIRLINVKSCIVCCCSSLTYCSTVNNYFNVYFLVALMCKNLIDNFVFYLMVYTKRYTGLSNGWNLRIEHIM